MSEVPSAPPPPPGAPAQTPPPPQATAVAPPAADVKNISEDTLMVPLEMIHFIEGQQHRISRDPQKMAELTASIKANGQNDPVKVMKDGDKYLLVYGHGRFEACKSLNFSHIRAELFRGNQQEASLLALSENVNREELNPIEIALGIREAMKRGSTVPEVATKLGKLAKDGSPDTIWVEQHLELLNLNAKQRADVANGMMGKTVASRLSKMESNSRNKIFSKMEEISEGEKKPVKAKSKGKGSTPPPAPAKKTGATLEKAKAEITGKSRDKFIGTKAARELYSEISKIDHEFVPTEEKAVIKECKDIIDYLLGKRKTKPFQLDID